MGVLREFEQARSTHLDHGMLISMRTSRYPSFEFGGKKGQTISSLCFKKVEVGEEKEM